MIILNKHTNDINLISHNFLNTLLPGVLVSVKTWAHQGSLGGGKVPAALRSSPKIVLYFIALSHPKTPFVKSIKSLVFGGVL